MEFKPSQQVLVRNSDEQVWRYDLFSHSGVDTVQKEWYQCVGGLWNQCIPFEDNEDLVGKCCEKNSFTFGEEVEVRDNENDEGWVNATFVQMKNGEYECMLKYAKKTTTWKMCRLKEERSE